MPTKTAYIPSGLILESVDYNPPDLGEYSYFDYLTKVFRPSVLFESSVTNMCVDVLEALYGPFMKGCSVLSFEESAYLVDYDKNPGFPYFYHVSTNGEALIKFFDVAWDRNKRLMSGEDVPLVFSTKTKDELRSKKSARVFTPGCLDNLILSNQLYEQQNQRLVDSLGQHPCTIGVPVPGPALPATMAKLTRTKTGKRAKNTWDFDAVAWDITFNLIIAAIICMFRSNQLPINMDPDMYRNRVRYQFSCVFNKLLLILGHIVRMPHQASGDKNTGVTNSMGITVWYFLAWVFLVGPYIPRGKWIHKFLSNTNHRANGDDNMGAVTDKYVKLYNPKTIFLWCYAHGLYLESSSLVCGPWRERNFLSFHLEERYYKGFSTLCCAGKLNKIYSGFAYKTAKSDFKTLCRFSALLTNIWVYREEYLKLKPKVDWYFSECVRKKTITDTEITMIQSQMLTEDQIFALHAGW